MSAPWSAAAAAAEEEQTEEQTSSHCSLYTGGKSAVVTSHHPLGLNNKVKHVLENNQTKTLERDLNSNFLRMSTYRKATRRVEFKKNSKRFILVWKHYIFTENTKTKNQRLTVITNSCPTVAEDFTLNYKNPVSLGPNNWTFSNLPLRFPTFQLSPSIGHPV